MTMFDTGSLTPNALTDVEEFDPESAGILKRRRTAALDKTLPEPTADDILRLRERLDGFYHDWIYGSGGRGPSAEAYDGARQDNFAVGVPGLLRIRDMRYHRDQMPKKYRDQLKAPYRFRTNFTANEIDRTVALATRNPPRFEIPAAGRDPADRLRSLKETRWTNMLIPALERAAGEPLVYPFADALFEGGIGIWEVFRTEAYDDIDFTQGADESDDVYLERTSEALAKSKLPFGVRVPDPLGVRLGLNDYGARCALVIETMQYRQIYHAQEQRYSAERLTEMRLPRPGDRGTPVVYPDGSTTTDGSVECIRYNDDRWYAYMVGGVFVDGPTEHGWPSIPVIPSWGSVTSSAHFAEKYMGIAWGTIEQEQAMNDLLTTKIDIGVTFARPKATIETPIQGQLRSPDNRPSTIDLRGIDGVPELMPGQKVVDAFAGFEDHIPSELLSEIRSIRQTSSLNPVAAGESPGADPSGFVINSLQASTQMRYEVLLDNLGRSVGQLADFIRKGIKDGPISEAVSLTILADDGVVENLSLAPEDVTDVPCVVTLDPMNDVNRLALRESLMAGNAAGFIPRRVVQEQGFGASDTKRWDDEIFEDKVGIMIMGLAAQRALEVVSGPPPDSTVPGASSGLVGPNGQPIRSKPTVPGAGEQTAGAPSGDNGAAPHPPNPASVGPEAAATSHGVGQRNANRARGGMRPGNQGSPL